MIGGPVLILAILLWFVLTGGKTQSTDDAQVNAARTAVSANVSGRVIEMDVHENQKVRTGDVLFKLDPAPFQTAVEEAEAQLAGARLTVQSLKAAYASRQADLKGAQDAASYSTREAARQRNLVTAGVASASQADQALNASNQGRQQLAAAAQGVASALADLGGRPDLPIDHHPKVMQAQAQLDRAELDLAYTVVHAAQPGTVTRVEQLQVGNYVSASQTLFFLVSGQPWIDADFKENQLAHMRIGQDAQIKLDAYPGQVLKAKVSSFSPGTGASFSVLPAENATGNWVKVTQRLPVRLTLVNPPADLLLHSGLSANVKVLTGRHGEGAAPAR